MPNFAEWMKSSHIGRAPDASQTADHTSKTNAIGVRWPALFTKIQREKTTEKCKPAESTNGDGNAKSGVAGGRCKRGHSPKTQQAMNAVGVTGLPLMHRPRYGEAPQRCQRCRASEIEQLFADQFPK